MEQGGQLLCGRGAVPLRRATEETVCGRHCQRPEGLPFLEVAIERFAVAGTIAQTGAPRRQNPASVRPCQRPWTKVPPAGFTGQLLSDHISEDWIV